MAFTPNYVILNDFPLFWDPALLAADIPCPAATGIPSRFAVVPPPGRS